MEDRNPRLIIMNPSTNKANNKYPTKRFNDISSSLYEEWEIVRDNTSDSSIPLKRHRRSSTSILELLQIKGKKNQIPQNLQITCNTSNNLPNIFGKTDLSSPQNIDNVSLSSVIDNNHQTSVKSQMKESQKLVKESKIQRLNKIPPSSTVKENNDNAANCSKTIKRQRNCSRTRKPVQEKKRSKSLDDQRRFIKDYCHKLRSRSQSTQTIENNSINDTTNNHHNVNGSSISSVDNIHYHTPDLKPTVKVSREVKQLEKMCKESKILTKYLNDSLNDTKLRQKKIPPSLSSTKSTKEKITVDHAANYSWTIEKPPKQRSKSIGCENISRSKNSQLVPQQNRRKSLADCRRLGETYCRKLRSQSQSSRINENDYIDDIAHNHHNGSGSVCNSYIETKITIERKKKTKKSSNNHLTKVGWDTFCFNCHQDKPTIPCSTCKRSYHIKCLRSKCEPKYVNNPCWKCPECTIIVDAEVLRKRTTKPEIDQLRTMLLFALKRLAKISNAKQTSGLSTAISCTVQMSFNILEGNVCSKLYKTTEEFLADVKWILHNCYTSPNRSTKLITAAKELIKACKQEMYEIDTCIQCYHNANVHKNDWFVKVCSKPHILLWAKLKGFPYWPAKMMGISATSLIDVRFFGQHDRAWLPARDCYLFSRDDPNVTTSKANRNSISSCLKEVDIYIENIRKKYGSFEYAEFKQTFNPHMSYDEYLQSMIPQYSPYIIDNDINDDDDLTNQLNLNSSALTYKIIKSPDNHLSIIKKINTFETGNEINNHKSTKNHHHHHHRTKLSSHEFPTDKDSPTNKIYEILPTSSGNTTKVVLKRKSSHSENTVEKKIQRKSIGKSSTVKQSTKRKLEPSFLSVLNSSIPIVDSTITSDIATSATPDLHHRDDNASGSDIPMRHLSVPPQPVPFLNSRDSLPPPPRLTSVEEGDENLLIPMTRIKTESNYDEEERLMSNLMTKKPTTATATSSNEQNMLSEIKTENCFTNDDSETFDNISIKVEEPELVEMSNVEPLPPTTTTISTSYQRPTRQRNVVATAKSFHKMLPKQSCNRFATMTKSTNLPAPPNLLNGNTLNGMVYIPYDNNPNSSIFGNNLNVYDTHNNTQSFSNSFPTPIVSRCKSTIASNQNNLQSASSSIIVTSSNHTTSSNNISINTSTTTNNIIQSTEPTILNTSTTTTSSKNTDDQPIVTSKQSEPIAETKSQLIQDYLKKVGSLFTAMLMKKIDDLVDIEQIDQLKTRILELEIQEVQYHFNKKITELQLAADKCKNNIKQKYDQEKQRLLEELKVKLDAENQQKYNEIKSKQWCSMCGQEAFYFCCFNISYCNTLCQKSHWPIHSYFCRNGNDLITNPKNISLTQSTTNKTDQQQTLLTPPIIATANIPNLTSIVLTESELNDLVANRLAAKPPGSELNDLVSIRLAAKSSGNENRSFVSPMLVPISSNPTATFIPPYHDKTLTNGGSLLKNQTNSTKLMSSKASTANNSVPPLCILSANNSARVSTSSLAKPTSVVQSPTTNLVSLTNGACLTIPRTCTIKMIQRNGIANNGTTPGLAVLSTKPSVSKSVVLTRPTQSLATQKQNATKKNTQVSNTIPLNCLNQIKQKQTFTIFNQQGGHLILTPIPSSNSSSSTSTVNTTQSSLPIANMQHHPPLAKIHVNGAVGGLQQKQ